LVSCIRRSGSYLNDGIARLYFEQTRRPLDACRAANDLGVSAAQLRGAIEALGSRASELAPLLTGGAIAREQLHPFIAPLLCSAAGLRNLPASCARAP